MRSVRIVLALAVTLSLASAVLAAPKTDKKAPPCPAAQLIDSIVKGLTLTSDQKTKLEGLKKEFGPKLADALKKQDVLTPDQKKAADKARKTAKAAGKDKKAIQAAVEAAVKMTDAQKTQQADATKKVGALGKALHEKVLAVLTDDQKAQLKAAHCKKKSCK